MNDIRLKITRTFTNVESEAMYGILEVPGLGVYTSLERSWNDNLPGESSVPEGFYTLEPHDGEKYKSTFALVGETVSHEGPPTLAVPRYACVLHWEDDGKFLQGCISIGDKMEWSASSGTSKLRGNRVLEVLKHLRKFDRIYLTIVED